MIKGTLAAPQHQTATDEPSDSSWRSHDGSYGDGWRGRRCRGDGAWRGRYGSDYGSATPDPTSTPTSSSPCRTTTTDTPIPTSIAALPSISPSSVAGQDTIARQSDQASFPPISLIAGITGSVFIVLFMSIFVWCFLRRRRQRQQILSHSKTILMSSSNGTPYGSPRISQQHDDLESQYRNSHIEQPFLGSEKSVSPRLTILDRQFPSRLSSPTLDLQLEKHSSASFLPIQLPAFPSPTLQEQRISNDMASAGAFTRESQLRSSPDFKPNRSPRQKGLRPMSIPKRISTILKKSCDTSEPLSPDVLVQSKDFYVDMLDLVIDTSPRTASRPNSGFLYSEPPSPCTPLPAENPFSPFASSPSSSPRQAHVRPRTTSSASSKKHTDSTTRCTNAGVISPRVSREAARRMVQDFPPPPPPCIPPPAIPVDAQELSSGLKAPRRRASTVTAAGKEARAGSCQQSESPRGKGRRFRTSSTVSAKNMVIRPPTSPPPVHRAPPQPISQLHSGELSIGHLRNLSQASSGSHLSRPQIANKSAPLSKPSISSRPPSWNYGNTLPEELTSSTSQARQQSRSRSTKPDLTQPMSTIVDRKVIDGSQDLEDIIAGAIAITATKKQIEIAESRPTSLSAD